MFRDSEKYLQTYLNQLDSLMNHDDFKGYHFTFVWLEGNSTDKTLELLENAGKVFDKRGADVILQKYDTPIPTTPGMNPDNALRWKRLSDSWNRCLNNIPECDNTIVVESDLIWTPENVLDCLSRVDKNIHHVIYPMLYHSYPNSDRFYDTHGFVKDGKNFEMYSPLYAGENDDEILVKLDLGGGMIVTTYEHQKNARFGEHDCIMHFAEGVNLYMNKTQKIKHAFADCQERDLIKIKGGK
jgi:hypothetical protein